MRNLELLKRYVHKFVLHMIIEAYITFVQFSGAQELQLIKLKCPTYTTLMFSQNIHDSRRIFNYIQYPLIFSNLDLRLVLNLFTSFDPVWDSTAFSIGLFVTGNILIILPNNYFPQLIFWS